jgi:hypothetical protein
LHIVIYYEIVRLIRGIDIKTSQENGEHRKTDKSSKPTSADVLHFADIISIRYRDDGLIKSGIITIDIEFSPSNLSINYLDVQYSDPILGQKVEDNPNILRNIDSYLRNKLLKLEYNF